MDSNINPEDFEASNANKMDEQLLVRFIYKSRKDNAATLEQGRPIFNEVEYVEIRIPGKRDTAFCGPATPRHKARFPKHYAAFKARTDAPATGTPLAEFPHVSRSMADELAFYNVKTVEDLVNISDTHAGKFMGMNKIRTIAKEWLEAADETAVIAERDAAKEQVAQMQAQMAEMQKQMLGLQAQLPEPARPEEPATVIQPSALDAPVKVELALEPIEEEHVPLKRRRASRAKAKAE